MLVTYNGFYMAVLYFRHLNCYHILFYK